MWELLMRTMAVWPTYFVNGLLSFANDSFLFPMAGRVFGAPGAYVMSGAIDAAKIQAAAIPSLNSGASFSSSVTGFFGAKV